MQSPSSRLPDRSTFSIGVDLTVNAGEILGIVGESGSGKSVTALSIMRLLPQPGRITGGRVLFQDQDLVPIPIQADTTDPRRRDLDDLPESALLPQPGLPSRRRSCARSFASTAGSEGRGATNRPSRLLADVGLPDPASVLRRYPHQLSGGMAQRVMIALALASSPRLLIADEPTTALDVTIQHQIIVLLKRLRAEHGLTQIVITHNLGVVAELCDRVAVMYAGTIVEEGPTVAIFDEPRHPYTRGLLAARARTDTTTILASIPGQVPDLRQRPRGCPFHPRCPFARPICSEVKPALDQVGPQHRAACHFWREIA